MSSNNMENGLPIVYGPIESRRLGLTVGINLLGSGPKACSFDCPYCDLGKTVLRLNKMKIGAPFPSIEELSQALNLKFPELRRGSEKINFICISGNGEPTLHPHFSETVTSVLQARDLHLPGVPVTILTSGAHLAQRRTVDAMNRLDERMVKIDAGGEKMFKSINSPLTRTTLSQVLAGAGALRDFIAQSFFVQGAVDNTLAGDVEDWIEVIGILRPKLVHIHGLSRPPAARGLLPANEDTLYTIASKLERRTQIKALVTP